MARRAEKKVENKRECKTGGNDKKYVRRKGECKYGRKKDVKTDNVDTKRKPCNPEGNQ